MKPPSLYPPQAMLIGFLNLAHMGALLLVALSLVAGIGLLLLGYSLAGKVVLALGGLILSGQVSSRARHMAQIRCLRLRGGELQVRLPQGSWLGAESMAGVSKQDYLFADPWRPITLGYPGLTITLKDPPGTKVGHLYPFGLDELRDRIYDYMVDKYPHLGEGPQGQR